MPLGDFSAEWLRLREPADTAARSSRLAQAMARLLAEVEPIRAVDLACGTGANARYLAEYLPVRQDWLLVDHDADLLAEAMRLMPLSAALGGGRAEVRQVDLRSIASENGDELFAKRALVTASALLDLVSDAWLRAVAERCRTAGAAVLFALSYDGRIECTPNEPEDERVRHLVNEHQRTDKGFGAAVGPNAADRAAAHFSSFGYAVQREQSDWILSPTDNALQRPLIEGWAHAAAAIAPAESTAIHDWCARRLVHLDAGRSRLIVGHEDLFAWP